MKMTKMMRGMIAALSVVALAACGGAEEATPGANQEKVLTVANEGAFPPFEKQVGDEIVGFDIDIINAIGEEEGFKTKIVKYGWDPLFEAVDKGQVDLAIDAITIKEDRKQKYDFSDPYFEAKQLILVPTDSTVAQLKDLEGKNIGVQSATSGEAVIQENFGKTYAGLKGYDDYPAAIDDLQLGRLDAVVGDNALILEYMKTLGDQKFKIVEDPSFQPEFYGIMMKKGNTEMVQMINSGLKKIKENGKYDEIYQKYFGK